MKKFPSNLRCICIWDIIHVPYHVTFCDGQATKKLTYCSSQPFVKNASNLKNIVKGFMFVAILNKIKTIPMPAIYATLHDVFFDGTQWCVCMHVYPFCSRYEGY